MRKLIIQGHHTKAKDVIGVLEMFGGINSSNYIASSPIWYFYINEHGLIDCTYWECPEKFYVIDNFLEKYPYRTGDIVFTPKYGDTACKILHGVWDDNGPLYVVETCDSSKLSARLRVDEIQAHAPLSKPSENVSGTGSVLHKLGIRGHETRGKEVIEIFDMLGGVHGDGEYGANLADQVYVMYPPGYFKRVDTDTYDFSDTVIYTLEDFLEKNPYKIGDKVFPTCSETNAPNTVVCMRWDGQCVRYFLSGFNFAFSASDLKPAEVACSEETANDCVEKSDGYHTFSELYEYRLLYNAAMFNELARQGLYDVHKSRRHSDGTYPFGNPDMFIVQANLPSGQISNHYEIEDWDLFDIPEKERADEYDGHTTKDVLKRLRTYLSKPAQLPTTPEECAKVLGTLPHTKNGVSGYASHYLWVLQKLLICRDAYWKIAGEEIIGSGKPWVPDFEDDNQAKYPLVYSSNELLEAGCKTLIQNAFLFPSEKMRDAFMKNFRDLMAEILKG